jgi:hypothetical protein
MDVNLQIKITALVEGLKEVAQLGQSLLEAGQDAKGLQDVAQGLDEIKAPANKAADGVKGLDNALKDIPKNAKNVKTALDEAFNALGGRSTAQVQAEIEKIKRALEDVRKSSTATSAEMARASDLAAARLRALHQEMESPAPKTFGQRMDDIKEKLKAADFKGAAAEVNGLTSGMGGLVGVASKVVGGFLAIKAVNWLGDKIQEAIQYGIEATKLAARVETLGITLQQVGRNAGYSSDGLAKAEREVMKLGITTQAARSSLTQMIQAGIGVNDLGTSIAATGERMTKAQELARAAQDLAVVSGQNSSDTLERMVLNIQQMDTMGLKFMGLVVDREAANEAFAASLNKSASALSEAEKKQAFYNATMVEANKLQGTYEAAMDSAGKKAQSMARYQEQLSLTLGNMLLPAYSGLIEAQTKYFDKAGQVAEEFAKNDIAANQLGGSIKELGVALSGIFATGLRVGLTEMTALSRLFVQVVDLATPVVEFIGQIGEGIQAWGNLFEIDNLLGKLDPIAGLINGIALAVAVVKDALTLAFAGAVGVVSNFVEALANTWIVLGKGIGLLNKDWGDAIQKAGQEMKGMAIAASEGATEIEKKVMSAEGAVGKFAKSFEEGSTKIKESKEYVDSYSKSIEALTALQRTGQINAKDLNTAWGVLNSSLDTLRKTGKLSEKDFQDLGKQMMAIPGVLEKTYTEAAAAAKTNLNMMKADVSESMSAGVKYFQVFVEGIASGSERMMQKMGTSAATASEDVLRVYTKIAEGAKTLNELIDLDKQLTDARKAGVIQEEQYAQALQITAVKFREIVDQRIKIASTTQDFDDLTAAVKKLGAQGNLTGLDVVEALRKIAAKAGTKLNLGEVEEILKNLVTQGKLSADKVGGALQLIANEAKNSRESVRLLNSQLEATGQQSLKIGQAHLGVVTAEVGVAKSRVDLWIAQNKYAQTGTDLDRLALLLAQQELAISEKQLQLARVRFEEEKTNMQLLISLQREKNALVALEKDGTNEVALAQLAAAQAAQAANEAKISGYRQQADVLQTQVLKLQEQQIVAKGIYDAMNQVKQSTEGAGRAMGGMGQSAEGAQRSVTNLSGSIQGATANFGMLGQKGDIVGESFNKVTGAATAMGIAGVNAGNSSALAMNNLNTALSQVFLGYGRAASASFSFSTQSAQSVAETSVGLGGISKSIEGLASHYNAMSNSSLVWNKNVNVAASEANTRISEMALSIRGLSSTFSNVGEDAWISLGRTSESAEQVDKVMTDLVTRTQEMGSGYDFMAGKSSSWSDSAREDLEKVRKSMNDLDQATRSYLEAATGLSYGAGGIGAKAGSIGTSGNAKPGETGFGGNTPGYYGNMRVGADGTIGGRANQDTRQPYEKGAAYGKDGFALNTQGQTVNSYGATFMSIFNDLKGYGLSEDRAKAIAKEFVDAKGDVPYFNNPGQIKYGGKDSTLGLAVMKAAQREIMGLGDMPSGIAGGAPGAFANTPMFGVNNSAGFDIANPFGRSQATQPTQSLGTMPDIPEQPKEYSPTGWVFNTTKQAWEKGPRWDYVASDPKYYDSVNDRKMDEDGSWHENWSTNPANPANVAATQQATANAAAGTVGLSTVAANQYAANMAGAGSVAPAQSTALPSVTSSTGSATVDKTIVVELKDGPKTIPLTMNSGDEQLLMEFLDRLQLSASAGG